MQDAERLALNIIELSRSTLMMDLRFMDAALFELAPTVSAGSGLMTDGSLLYFDPQYVIDSFYKERTSVTRSYLHIMMHCIFSHSFVDKSIDREMWDTACDIAAENAVNEINIRCVRSEREQAQKEYTDGLKKSMRLLTAERIYRFFKNEGTDRAELRRVRALFMCDGHDKWYNERPQSMHRGAGAGKSVKKDGDTGEATSNSDKPFESRRSIVGRWKKLSEGIQAELENRAREWGDKTGSLTKSLSALHREKHSYADFLRRFSVLGETMKIDDDEFDYIFYTYGLKLYEKMPLIEPLEYKETLRIKEFVIAIDTSGSVQGKLVEKFVNKTYNILKESENFFKKIKLHIIQCDTEIKEDVIITNDEEFEEYIKHMELRGFSGTDFRPVFDRVDELIRQKHFTDLRGLIYFTDGLGTFPEKRPPYDAAFVFLYNGEDTPDVPPWAIKLVLDEEDI